MKDPCLVFVLTLLIAVPATALEPVPVPSPTAIDAATARLAPHGATLVVRDAASGAVLVRIGGERAARRLPPCSTFKIPNTLISLAAGAVTREENLLARDRERTPTEAWWPRSWDRDHDLRSALENSVLWYFQELARRVGSEEMQRQVDRLGYGNRDLSGGVDRFWLSSTLKISADEQTAFLGRLVRGELGFPAADVGVLREGIRRGGGDGWEWFGKTGSCALEGGRFVGWLVGWVERGEEAVTFAFWAEEAGFRQAWDRRDELVEPALRDLGVLPGQ